MILPGRPPLDDADKQRRGTLRPHRMHGEAVATEPLAKLPPAPSRFRATKPEKGLSTRAQVQAAPHQPFLDFEQRERLKAEARTAWRWFGAQAIARRTLTAGDLRGLEDLCWWWSWLLELQERVCEQGPTTASFSGTGAVVATVANPVVGVLERAEAIVQRWLAHFGLTPAARVRVRAPATPAGHTPADPYAALRAPGPGPLRAVAGGRGNARAEGQ